MELHPEQCVKGPLPELILQAQLLDGEGRYPGADPSGKTVFSVVQAKEMNDTGKRTRHRTISVLDAFIKTCLVNNQ